MRRWRGPMKEIKFTPTEQRIYDEMRQAARHQEKTTVAVIAQRAGVVPSSVVKVSKKLGYTGWKDMYYSLSHRSTNSLSLSFTDFDFLADQEIFHYIGTLSDLLIRHRKDSILVDSIGDAEYAGSHFIVELWKRGIEVRPYNRELLDVQLKDREAGILFIINESGVVLLHSCLRGREKGYRVVSVTGNSKSPLASNSDISVELENKKSTLEAYLPNFFTARVLMFIELLFVSYDEKMKKKMV